jgi:hypothetical protein
VRKARCTFAKKKKALPGMAGLSFLPIKIIIFLLVIIHQSPNLAVGFAALEHLQTNQFKICQSKAKIAKKHSTNGIPRNSSP